MTQPIYGFGAIAGLAEEVDWGDPEDSTHWLPILRHGMNATPDKRPVPYLGVANGQDYHNTRDEVLLSVSAGGDLETCFHYDSKAHLLLLKHALGGVVTTHPATPYVHTFGLDTDGVLGLTLQTVHGQGISQRAEVWPGCRVNTLALSVDAAGWMTANASLIAKKSNGPANLVGTPAYAAAEMVRAGNGSLLDFDGSTFEMASYRLNVNNNLQRRFVIGDLYTQEPVPAGFASIMSELTLPWNDNDLYDAFMADDLADAFILFSGSGNNSMRVNLNNTRVMAVTRGVSSAGALQFTASLQHFDNPGTSQGLGIVIHNDNTTAV